ncbi:MAG: dihydropteroate synthase [Hydrogenophilales bacterium CG03_land_8_20_14_0_80_62_28]|nr:dihydropteroate synthase [Betaproteobacteria bacterium]OIO79936.1 MAG: dihydropteroate synthase [Hydrogenophilaceae bacterium CG1_02_62_390]PIV23130.1 MAG: dihydropteroate synthase [Hydrogenophilales bacterium CG03_land_8_20_14_0_80_62_28]PIW38666.1 MAG: dihydropteroate synthase [Hydrogenophilales bacterium CG15_BIG_FIL_POST_REV_8_21_14_020_62_31]PIW72270.1 MAG: dihydropteroate synthase [Hydrogenophilales bacterium CG12_big_fil_rev_8_21_14_0_65_61_21]PIX00899.1 MAG: dihydropteroate synthase
MSLCHLPDRPLVMGIVNVTPDSFSDGGRFIESRSAIAHARRLVEEGADILDIGGESTRPGAQPVSEQEEMDRLMPVLEGVRGLGVAVSVDTMKPAVMRVAIEAGAAMINDVYAFRTPGAWAAVRDSDCALCVMHMLGEPRTMQEAPRYDDVVAEVEAFLAGRIVAAEANGIARSRLLVDPGFGFGKTLNHNIALIRALPRLARLAPAVVGVSRKRMIGALTGRDIADRLAGSLAAAIRAVENGAAVVRVHDVAATVDVLKVWEATK